VDSKNNNKEQKMIKNSKQDWTVGKIVKVGFMTLRVKWMKETPGDYAPDKYLLECLKGEKLYVFVPHKGLERLDYAEQF
jgi:hypothetical protein